MNDKSKLELIGEIAQANNKNLELIQEINQLQSNWNSLREWLRNDDNRVYLCNQNRKNGKVFEAGFKVGLIVVLDKMNELEGVDK